MGVNFQQQRLRVLRIKKIAPMAGQKLENTSFAGEQITLLAVVLAITTALSAPLCEVGGLKLSPAPLSIWIHICTLKKFRDKYFPY